MAATVRFDEKLAIAMKINIQSCKDILKMCKEIKNLKSVVHISTAYSQCIHKKLEERFYTATMDPNKLLGLGECAKDTLLENLTPM